MRLDTSEGGGPFEFYTPTGCENFWGSGGGGGGLLGGAGLGGRRGECRGRGFPRGMKRGGGGSGTSEQFGKPPR